MSPAVIAHDHLWNRAACFTIAAEFSERRGISNRALHSHATASSLACDICAAVGFLTRRVCAGWGPWGAETCEGA